MIRVPLPDAPPPHEAHRRLAHHHGTTFILESREGPERLARYSFVGFDPAGTVRCDRQDVRVTGALPAPSRDQSPLEYLRRIQAFYQVHDHHSPFVGGLVGSVGYGFARLGEPTLERGAEETWPRFLFGLYLDGLVYDHIEGTAHYVSRGEDRSQRLQQILADDVPREALAVSPIEPLVDRPTFEAQVQEARRLIRAGECFQIVVSRAYQADHEGPLHPFYDWLRDAAAVPYLYYLRFEGEHAEGLTLVGASPEMLVRVRQGRCETFPIAGTRPLTGDDATDEAAAQDLLADRKETAEHAMLVDLARNDLGRVSAPGSVDVEDYQHIQRFRTVQHIVSRVASRLADDKDAFDALAAVFPAGTVSGAPKVRAMEHIDTIEARERGPYAGAVAYASFNGDFDSAIAIRSLSAQQGRVTVQAGAGIVLHSDPTTEFHETRHKAGTMLQGLARFGGTTPDEEGPATVEADA